jgi:Mg-chelatase subunit ChlD
MKGLKSYLFLFFILFSFLGKSQLSFDKTTLDFGELSNDSPKFMDVTITNIGSKRAFILNYKADREVACLFNTQAAEKDSSLIFRVQPNPKKLGKFNYQITIYTSDRLEPTILTVKGNLKEEIYDPLAKMQACPDFRSTPSIHATDFKLTIKTIDKSTKQNLENTVVYLLQNGKQIGQFIQGKDGKIKVNTPLGFIYFYASLQGYKPSEKCQYVNIVDNTVMLELERDNSINIKEEKLTEIQEKPQKELEETLKEEPITLQETYMSPALENIPLNQFKTNDFEAINVLFIVDISSSMGIGNRMELMKFSLLELSNLLRKEDKIGFVSYSTNAQILLPPTSGTSKTEIQSVIQKLKAGGMTAGGEGIKLGCKTLSNELIEGKNIIYIITDGAFNKDSKNYMESIEKYKKMGIQICVIGIQNSENDAKNMKKIADLGGGTYTSIQKLADAKTALIQEIRNQTYRKN